MANATTTIPGDVQLAGDLTGTATAPLITNTTVTPGSYSLTSLTVDAKGRVTAAASASQSDIATLLGNATTSTKGVVQIGTNINVSSGVISVPAATTGTQGAVQIGSGLSVTGGTVSAALPDATTSSKGQVQVGAGLSVSGGIISSLALVDATTSSKGAVQIGSGLAVTAGVVSIDPAFAATNSVLGLVKSANVNNISITTGSMNVGSNVVKYNTSGTFTAAQRNTVQALTDAATIAVNLALSNAYSVTLAGNRTLGAPSNMQPGTYTFIISQDASGSRTLAYNAVYKFKNGADKILSTAASAKDLLVCVSDGTSMYCALNKAVS